MVLAVLKEGNVMTTDKGKEAATVRSGFLSLIFGCLHRPSDLLSTNWSFDQSHQMFSHQSLLRAGLIGQKTN
jgi:hypothetical protein